MNMSDREKGGTRGTLFQKDWDKSPEQAEIKEDLVSDTTQTRRKMGVIWE